MTTCHARVPPSPGTRSRGIYATLPSPPDADRLPPGPGRGGHNDGHPFQLGVEAYIDDGARRTALAAPC